jgi:hypothetical protein
MKTLNPKVFIILFFVTSVVFRVSAQNTGQSLLSQLTSNTSFSGQLFIIYQIEETEGEYFNEFTLRRGYITFNKRFNDIFSVRFTQDITLDEEGSDAGNIEMRLKYCLLRINNHFLPALRNSYWEVGLIHRPWFAFEDKVNDYRVQGAMFMDKYDILGSADFGVSLTGLIGGEVDDEYQRRVSSQFPGLYGSYSIGVYNGGGYHAIELNSNKTVEGRLTLRPLGNYLPGLQVSYNFVNGKGNTPSMPDFNFNHLYLSWQSKPVIVAGQIYRGRGNAGGTYIDEDGDSYINSGYSVFGEAKILPTNIALMSRIDKHHVLGEGSAECSSIIAGVCYRFQEKNKLLLNTDIRSRDGFVTRFYEIAIEIRF